MGATTQTEVSIAGVITVIEIIEETWNTENNVPQETIEEMTDAEMVNIDFKLVILDLLKNSMISELEKLLVFKLQSNRS